MLRCKDVAELIGTDTLLQAPLRQRLAVKVHLAMCRHCRAFARSLTLLARMARQAAGLESSAGTPQAELVVQNVRLAAATWPTYHDS